MRKCVYIYIYTQYLIPQTCLGFLRKSQTPQPIYLHSKVGT